MPEEPILPASGVPDDDDERPADDEREREGGVEHSPPRSSGTRLEDEEVEDGLDLDGDSSSLDEEEDEDLEDDGLEELVAAEDEEGDLYGDDEGEEARESIGLEAPLRVQSAPSRSVRALMKETLDKIDEVFVDPSGFRKRLDLLRGRQDHRVFVIHGRPRTGKFTAGVRLGLELLREQTRQPRAFVYDFHRQHRSTLSEFAMSEQVERDSVYVVPAAFQKGIRTEELSLRQMAEMIEPLQRKNAYIVLTTTMDVVELTRDVEADLFELGEIDLKRVLDEHLRRYASGKEIEVLDESHAVLVRETWEAKGLAQHLDTAPKIEKFCGRLAHSSEVDDLTQEKIVLAARQVGEYDVNQARRDFRRLESLNHRLLAMLVRVFDHLDRRSLEDLYVRTVQQLRDDGVEDLRDARQHGFEDLYEAIRVEPPDDPNGILHFEESLFRRVVERETRSFQHLLWSAVDELWKQIQTQELPERLWHRQALVTGIGRVGVGDELRFRELVDELVDSEGELMSAVAAHVFCGFLDGMDGDGSDDAARDMDAWNGRACLVRDTIKAWNDSKLPLRKSAAAYAASHAYIEARTVSEEAGETPQGEAAADRANEFLDQIDAVARDMGDLDTALRAYEGELDGRELSDEARRSAITERKDQWLHGIGAHLLSALDQVLGHSPTEAVGLLESWMEYEAGTPQRGLALWAAHRLFQGTPLGDTEEDPGVDAALPVLVSNRHQALLDLLPALLGLEDNRSLRWMRLRVGRKDVAIPLGRRPIGQVIVGHLARWLQVRDWPARVHLALLRAANRCSEVGRHNLRVGMLRSWLDTEDLDAQGIARSILSRCAVLQGGPLDLPGCGRVLLVTEPAVAGSTPPDRTALVGELVQRLAPQVDLEVHLLGRIEPVAAAGEVLDLARLDAGERSTGLLHPLLDRIARGEGALRGGSRPVLGPGPGRPRRWAVGRARDWRHAERAPSDRSAGPDPVHPGAGSVLPCRGSCGSGLPSHLFLVRPLDCRGPATAMEGALRGLGRGAS